MPIAPTLLLLALLLLAGLAGGLAWRAWRDLAEARARAARLEAANAALSATVERADTRARLLDGVLAALSDGVSVFDGELRLAGWNPRFAECAGVPRRALRIGMPMEEVLRLQAEAGEFGLVDPDEEVKRRLALLRAGPLIARTQRERPDGSVIELRRAALPGGGFVTLYTPQLPTTEAPLDPDTAAAFAADWLARLPRLTAAAADGDAPATRATAHALRGLAANAGWTALVLALASIEASAEAGDMPEVRALTALLPLDPPR